MSARVDPEWLQIRQPFDEAALDRGIVASIRAWADRSHGTRPLRVVDLGSGTGAALRRAVGWLGRRSVDAFAVDGDSTMLAAARPAWRAEGHAGIDDGLGGSDGDGDGGTAGRPPVPEPYAVTLDGRRITVAPIVSDALAPLAAVGGPEDGSIDLVLGHALADLVPLDALGARARALLRPGGLLHLALTYDGETAYEPAEDPALEARVMAAYHRHMDLPRARNPRYGGSAAGRRLGGELQRAGFQIVRAGPSDWDVGPGRGDTAATGALLDRMIGFVVGSLRELGDPADAELERWARGRRALLDAGRLGLRVQHLDLLARRPTADLS